MNEYTKRVTAVAPDAPVLTVAPAAAAIPLNLLAADVLDMSGSKAKVVRATVIDDSTNQPLSSVIANASRATYGNARIRRYE
jgi:hypothetical protein